MNEYFKGLFLNCELSKECSHDKLSRLNVRFDVDSRGKPGWHNHHHIIQIDGRLAGQWNVK